MHLLPKMVMFHCRVSFQECKSMDSEQIWSFLNSICLKHKVNKGASRTLHYPFWGTRVPTFVRGRKQICLDLWEQPGSSSNGLLQTFKKTTRVPTQIDTPKKMITQTNIAVPYFSLQRQFCKITGYKLLQRSLEGC